MKHSDTLISQRDEYSNCLDKAISTAQKFYDAIQTTRSLIEQQRSSYTIDGIAGCGNFLMDLLNYEIKVYNYIADTVIPYTKDIIKSYNNTIDEQLKIEAEEAGGRTCQN